MKISLSKIQINRFLKLFFIEQSLKKKVLAILKVLNCTFSFKVKLPFSGHFLHSFGVYFLSSLNFIKSHQVNVLCICIVAHIVSLFSYGKTFILDN